MGGAWNAQDRQRPGCFLNYFTQKPSMVMLGGDGKAADTINLYYIEQLKKFPTVAYKCGVDYIEYAGQQVTANIMVYRYGYSVTASTVVEYDNDVPWSWYNSEMNLYWDIESNSWNAKKPLLVKDVVVYDTEQHEVVQSFYASSSEISNIPCQLEESQTEVCNIPFQLLNSDEFIIYEEQEAL